ncbi:hypothetical protein EPA93_18735 [Ktedonosporobacter rubrisoli]|uniref:Uncharacterized protein n=1 Tax=Ktedonosporobacter rubrisoli TaxID=2509675 RepID=A0A4P6JRT6_KTERU|nr:DUF5691 domain-containing protein [Ktedonosporobacter rubrisoli]QBD77920.1 hypothetical protein EPA93_18735 [Ktedonosporobacter rubrisoli]
MDTIVVAAIVGTGQGNTQVITETPLGSLAAQLPQEDVERSFLLTAGALATYWRAGYVPEKGPAALQPAASEQLPVCPAQIERYLHGFLHGTHSQLLPEVLTLLRKRGMRLPYKLLPDALEYATRHQSVRSSLIPLLGVRGRWLSELNPAWSWTTQVLSIDQETFREQAETIWQEGQRKQRLEALELMRSVDAAKGREWLQEAWRKENANTREEFLQALTAGLSIEDQAFLETALQDRRAGVKEIASILLASVTITNVEEWLAHIMPRTANNWPDLMTKLLLRLPQRDAERYVLAQCQESEDWVRAAKLLPQPWSEECARAFLLALQQASEQALKTSNWYYWPLLAVLDALITGVPVAELEHAWQVVQQLTERDDISKESSSLRQWQEKFNSYVEILRLRKQIIEEIG